MDALKQEQTKYETYLSERNSLINAEKESSHFFDKAIITLATGALGVSLTFIEKIGSTPQKPILFILSFAWAFFCASMLSTLISFLTSQSACRKQREILEATFFHEKAKPETNVAGIITNVLNWVSIILFILGVVSLIVYCYKSL